MPSLVIIQPGGKTRTVPISRSGMIIGRSVEADIRIEEVKCSRQHLKVNLINTAIEVEDLGSANGSTIRGIRIKKVVVQPTDIVEIGSTQLRFVRDDAAAPAVVAAPKQAAARTSDRKQAAHVSDRKPAARSSDRRPAAGRPVDPFANSYHLELLKPGAERGTRYTVNDKLTVGRKAANTIQLDGKKVSGEHAEIVREPSGYCLYDLGSTNGTQLNGGEVTPEVPHALSHGDTITVGEHRLLWRVPVAERASSVSSAELKSVKLDAAEVRENSFIIVGGPLRGRRIPLTVKLSIGRTSNNDLVLEGKKVSSTHAEVMVSGKEFVVVDANSTNGTFVNGKRIKSHTLRHQDVVVIGPHALAFDAAGETLDLDGRIAQMRSAGAQKVWATFIVGLMVVAGCVLFVTLVADQVIVALTPQAPTEDPNAAPPKISALSFDPEDPQTAVTSDGGVTQVAGWSVACEGGPVDAQLIKGDGVVQDGRFALALTPAVDDSGATNPETRRVTVTTTAGTDAAKELINALSTIRGTSLRIGLSYKSTALSGVLALRLVTDGRDGRRVNVAAWTGENAGGFQRIEGNVPMPRGETVALQISFEGTFERLILDGVSVRAGDAPSGGVGLDPVVLHGCTPALELGEPAPGLVRFTLGGQTIVRRLSLALLSERNDGYVELASSAEGAGPTSRSDFRFDANRGYEWATGFHSPAARKLGEARLQVTSYPGRSEAQAQLIEDPRFGVSVSTFSLALGRGEHLALKLELGRTSDTKFALTAYNDDATRVRARSHEILGPVRGLREVVWGNGSENVALEVSAFGGGELQMFTRDTPEGPIVYALVADAATQVPPTFNLRPFSTIERQQALQLRDSLARLEGDASRRGEVLKLAAQARLSYTQFPDVIAIFDRYFVTTKSDVDSLYTQIGEIYESARLAAQSGRYNTRDLRRGQSLARRFAYEFSALVDGDPNNPYNRISRWERELTEWEMRAKQDETEASIAARRRQAVQLLRRAYAANDPRSGRTHSYLQAVLFAEHAIHAADYDWAVEPGEVPGINTSKGIIEAARELIDSIEQFWADTPRMVAKLDELTLDAAGRARRGRYEDACTVLEGFVRLYPYAPKHIDARYRLLRLSLAIDWSGSDISDIPIELDDNVAARCPNGRLIRDPWGRPFVYERIGGTRRFRLTTHGGDARPGGDGEDADLEQVSLLRD